MEATITGANTDAYGYDSHGTWSLAWLGSTPDVVDDGDSIYVATYLTASYFIYRGFLVFDLSGLSSGYSVTSAKLQLKTSHKPAATKDIWATEGKHVPPYTAGDYQAYGVEQSSLGALSSGDLTEGEYSDVVLGTAAYSLIEAALGSTLYLALRTDADATNDSGLTWPSGNYVGFHSGRIAGSEPKLVLDYSKRYPSNDVIRVSSIRHVYRPGSYRLEAGFGDTSSSIELSQHYREPSGAAPADSSGFTGEQVNEVHRVTRAQFVKETRRPGWARQMTPEEQTRWGYTYAPSAAEPEIPASTYIELNRALAQKAQEDRMARVAELYKKTYVEEAEKAGFIRRQTWWTRLTPWKEEAGETFGSEVMERLRGIGSWFGGLFR